MIWKKSWYIGILMLYVKLAVSEDLEPLYSFQNVIEEIKLVFYI